MHMGLGLDYVSTFFSEISECSYFQTQVTETAIPVVGGNDYYALKWAWGRIRLIQYLLLWSSPCIGNGQTTCRNYLLVILSSSMISVFSLPTGDKSFGLDLRIGVILDILWGFDCELNQWFALPLPKEKCVSTTSIQCCCQVIFMFYSLSNLRQICNYSTR